ncbi:hypothetical protein [Dichelobacter nodosus]|uniref:Uncharacterized protein n=1 Tax=Dichelobacter nodosus (strain VCS1703A) TaxID=246195 RepID=A5EUY6_DICNV|nr:hypothetical protein [Dichelobacter nodosus]ABQ13980.1 hypothetical protein DNO_0766 [Dichelobacter nodosus VCS1703A]KNZ40117.1 hypothetical protein AKG33_00120 [Dichelobacter nodosus]
MIRNITRQEFARRLGVKRTKFHDLLAGGCLPPPRRIGRDLVWLEPVVDAFIILAYGYPMPIPELSAELEHEVREAVMQLHNEKI